MKGWLVAAIAAAAILIALVASTGGGGRTGPGSVATSAAQTQLPASSVLKINPRALAVAPSPPPAPAANVPPEITQLRSRTGWAPLRERIASGGNATPTALYVQAEIYNRCAKRQPRPGAAQDRARARERFVASMDGQPDLAQRLAAWDKANVDPCEGVTPEEYSDERLDAMIAAAAQAGDARAQAWRLSRAVDAALDSRKDQRQANVISEEQVETIRRTLASRDPGVVREYQGLLASTVNDGTWRLPGIEGRVDERALYGALTLVACDLGENCAADSRELLNSCAQNGYCGAGNLYDYLYFYESSPNSAQLMERYRQALLQAINSGDLSGLRISREPTNNSRGFMFRGRRGP